MLHNPWPQELQGRKPNLLLGEWPTGYHTSLHWSCVRCVKVQLSPHVSPNGSPCRNRKEENVMQKHREENLRSLSHIEILAVKSLNRSAVSNFQADANST